MNPPSKPMPRRSPRQREKTPQAPFAVGGDGKAGHEGPTPLASTHEGASTGKVGNSRAGGAAGQLTPKDER